MSTIPNRLKVARAMKAPTPTVARPLSLLPIHDRLRWSLAEVAELVNLSPNKVRDLEAAGEFPPRIAVPKRAGARLSDDDDTGKQQFVPDEVRAWAAGHDWRARVANRLQQRNADAP